MRQKNEKSIHRINSTNLINRVKKHEKSKASEKIIEKFRKTEQSHFLSEDSPYKHKAIMSQTIFSKGFDQKKSDIPNKTSSFFVLYQIWKKDRNFFLPLPDSIILNCDFKAPIEIKCTNSLEFTYLYDGLSEVKQQFIEITKKIVKKPLVPEGIMKYSNGRKKLLINREDIYENPIDIGQNIILQTFVPPKGLRVTRFRVVIINNQVKVFIITNNCRYDAKTEVFNKTNHTNEDFNVKVSVMHHNQIMKYVNNLSMTNLPNLEKLPRDKKKIFEVFKDDPTKPKKHVKSVVIEEKNDNDKFLTQTDLEKCQFYEGKVSGYTEIVKITEYLQNKINSLYLKDEILEEFSVDFVQDFHTNFFFLKIVYGKLKKCKKVYMNPKPIIKSNFPQEHILDEFFDVIKDDNSLIIQKLLHPESIPLKKHHESFIFHKKFYGFD